MPEPEAILPEEALVAEGVYSARIYWIRGSAPKGARLLNAVKDPPCSGYQQALIIPGKKGRSTIFCPYSFSSFVVPNACSEVAGAKLTDDDLWVGNPTALAESMEKRWNDFQSRGYQRDYDAATRVFKLLGAKVPEQLMRGGEEDSRRKGGKEAEDTLKKPVKRNSKRGKFLSWFLEEDGVRSVREAMAEFDMTRSNALSYLFMLQKDHGIGYELRGDMAHLDIPGNNPQRAFDDYVETDDDDDQEGATSQAEEEEEGSTASTSDEGEDDWLL